jgi:small subunit ribosomal protein S5
MEEREVREFEEKIAQISRVSKKTKGGNKIGFSVLVIVGDRKGKVGVGLGKALDVRGAIRKGIAKAKKELIKVPLKKTTIPYEVRIKKGAARIIIKPAPEGTGLIAGGPVRMVVELAGIKDVVAKILGTNNKASNVYATIEALKRLAAISENEGK